MGQRNHAVHIGIGRQNVRREMMGDLSAGVRGTVDRRDYGDVVSRADAPIITLVAHKRPALSFGDINHWPDVCPEQVIALKVLHRQIVNMNVIARCDRLCGKADHLPVAADGFTRFDGTQRDFMPNGDKLPHRDMLTIQRQHGSRL